MPVALASRVRVSACAALLFQMAFAAEPTTVAVPLTLQDAVNRTLLHNLDLKAAAYELEAQQGRLRQARARPSPEVGLLVENVLGTGNHRSFESAETTLSLGFALEHGARKRRGALAEAGVDLLTTERSLQRLDMAAETARRFVAVVAAQQTLIDARAATKLVEETVGAVQLRVRAAKVPQAEEARAQAQLALIRLDEEHAEHELESARRRLAALWASTEADFGVAAGDLTSLPALESIESVRARLKDNADIVRLLSEKRVREAEVRVAQMRRHPPWHVTVGMRRFEATDDQALIVGLTVPIGSRDQAQGAMTEALAQSAYTDAKAQALTVRLDAEFFALYQDLNQAYTEVDTLRKEVLPLIETAAEQSRYAYERGRYGYIEWVAAQRELLELRRALLDAYADVHLYRIEIERLTGAALSVRAP